MARRGHATKETGAVDTERLDKFSDDAAWDRRQTHRRAGLAAVKRSRDFLAVQTMVVAGDLSPEDVPTAPDSEDRTRSKRQWLDRKMITYTRMSTANVCSALE